MVATIALVATKAPAEAVDSEAVEAPEGVEAVPVEIGEAVVVRVARVVVGVGAVLQGLGLRV